MAHGQPDREKARKKEPQTPAGAWKPRAKPEGAPRAKKPQRPDPTRYGDWEKNGRCIDF